MDRREFQLIEGSSKKFWAIQLNGTSFTVNYGRIGTNGQTQEKSFSSEDAARREYDKLILEKTKKGYAEVGATPGTVAPAPAVTEKTPSAKKASKSGNGTAPQDSSVIPSERAPTSPPPAQVSSSASAPIGDLKRTINLAPEDRFFVTWEEPVPLEKPAPPEFDLEDALKRLRTIGTTISFYENDWSKARIPKFPSKAEAQFWLLAFEKTKAGEQTPQQIADELAQMKFDGKMPSSRFDGVIDRALYAEYFYGCVAAILGLNELAKLDSRYETFDCFRTHMLPYLTTEQRRELRSRLSDKITPTVPQNYYDTLPPYYWVGALVGCHEETLSVIRAFPDGYYQDPARSGYDFSHQPQWLICGLPDKATAESELRRLGIKLRDEEHVRAWLALTGFEALDVIAMSVCQNERKDDAVKLAQALRLVEAPEAALPALNISIASKASQIGKEWLMEHPLEAAVGITPTAMGHGKIAEAAREHLQLMRRNGQAEILKAAMKHLTPEQGQWLEREILNDEEESIPELAHADMPDDLRSALETKAPAPPPWISMAPLPLIKIQGKKLATADLHALVGTLKATSLGTHSPLIAALKNHADRNSLDAFAWKLANFWLNNGAVSKDKWALGAIGHIGGDASVLKLTPLVRDWPGESQHQRAVFGLECLRAVGSDTAMMALNGIAQKLKFKGLKEKAQAMMEEIAQARGLTREQLADRIVPDCGLDERGSRIFDFGPRQFRFVLGPEMKPLVRDAAGKVRPDLPAPNSSDDREKAESAVADWKLLKKTLREVLKIQADRLEDAMITGRRWTVDEFETLVVKHPLMVNLARQLVFAVYNDAGKVTQSFRVTEDQTLADQNDDGIDRLTSGKIGVAHPAHLDDAAKGAWGQLLSDYEIIPPFQQLGRTICPPDPEDLDKTEITRFRGPKIPGIVMYGMLERSHWSRDTPADGGGFVQHSRYFPSAEVTAFIRYTGMAISYYVEPQELEGVYFVPGHVRPEYWGDHKNRLKIKDVDPVVLSEVLRLANAIVSKAE